MNIDRIFNVYAVTGIFKFYCVVKHRMLDMSDISKIKKNIYKI